MSQEMKQRIYQVVALVVGILLAWFADWLGIENPVKFMLGG